MGLSKSLSDFISLYGFTCVHLKESRVLKIYNDKEELLFKLWHDDELFGRVWKWSITMYDKKESIQDIKLNVGNIKSAIRIILESKTWAQRCKHIPTIKLNKALFS